MSETGSSQSMDRLEWICRHPDRAASVVEEPALKGFSMLRPGFRMKLRLETNLCRDRWKG